MVEAEWNSGVFDSSGHLTKHCLSVLPLNKSQAAKPSQYWAGALRAPGTQTLACCLPAQVFSSLMGGWVGRVSPSQLSILRGLWKAVPVVAPLPGCFKIEATLGKPDAPSVRHSWKGVGEDSQ